MDTEVVAILDMSLSMEDLTSATIEGFNVWLDEVAKGQQQGDDVRITVVTFDTVIERHVERVAIRSCPRLGTPGNPYKPRGNTALFDAVGDTLVRVKEFVPKGKRALVMIVTDGDENSSQVWNHVKLGALMAELEATDRYAFNYMGAGVDSWAQARSYGDTSGMTTRSASFDRSQTRAAFAHAGAAGFGYVMDRAEFPVMRNSIGEQVMAGLTADANGTTDAETQVGDDTTLATSRT